jgi:chromosome segregation ATPase
MKVIVRCANNRITKSEMEREVEKLFQENKDLRLSESHLRDELNLISQQSEIRRQKMVEKDKEIDHMRAKIATVCAERDNFEASYKQVLQWWEEAQSKTIKAEERAEEYRIALMESDFRVDELEKQLAWVREEVARLTNERDTAVNENTALTLDVNDLQDKCEVERNLRVEAEKAYDQVASEAYDTHQQITNLTIENTRLENKVEKLEAEVDVSSYDNELRERLEHFKKAASIWQEKAEAIQECREDAEARLYDTSNRFIEMYQEKVNNENEAREVIAELHDKLNDRNARVDELERRVTFLQINNENLRTSNDGYIDVINEDLDRIRALEAELEIVKGDLAGEREDYADMEKELARMTALASDYFEKWNTLRNNEARVARFNEGFYALMKKIAADDTDFSFEEIAEK